MVRGFGITYVRMGDFHSFKFRREKTLLAFYLAKYRSLGWLGMFPQWDMFLSEENHFTKSGPSWRQMTKGNLKSSKSNVSLIVCFFIWESKMIVRNSYLSWLLFLPNCLSAYVCFNEQGFHPVKKLLKNRLSAGNFHHLISSQISGSTKKLLKKYLGTEVTALLQSWRPLLRDEDVQFLKQCHILLVYKDIFKLLFYCAETCMDTC